MFSPPISAGRALTLWGRGSARPHRRPMAALFQANVSHCKQQLADKLGIEPRQPGSIHFAGESRGFDEEFFLQLLSERKEVKLSRGVRTTVWKRIRDRSEGLDLAVMILCLLDVFNLTVPKVRFYRTQRSSAPATRRGRLSILVGCPKVSRGLLYRSSSFWEFIP
jgi:phage terminase large subunit GpA-like protein